MLKFIVFSFISISSGLIAMAGNGSITTTTSSRPVQPRMAAMTLLNQKVSTEKEHEHCCTVLSRLLLNGP